MFCQTPMVAGRPACPLVEWGQPCSAQIFQFRPHLRATGGSGPPFPRPGGCPPKDEIPPLQTTRPEKLAPNYRHHSKTGPRPQGFYVFESKIVNRSRMNHRGLFFPGKIPAPKRMRMFPVYGNPVPGISTPDGNFRFASSAHLAAGFVAHHFARRRLFPPAKPQETAGSDFLRIAWPELRHFECPLPNGRQNAQNPTAVMTARKLLFCLSTTAITSRA